MQLQKLVEAYGQDHWQDGPEYVKYYYPDAVKILDQADVKREQKKTEE